MLSIWPRLELYHLVKHSLFTTYKSRLLTTLKNKAYENIVGKGEIANNQDFLLFSQCFPLIPK